MRRIISVYMSLFHMEACMLAKWQSAETAVALLSLACYVNIRA